jgi:hypothetical protein
MSLKVFDLQCDAGHLFEGWFGSHDDYDAQQARGLMSCPLCQSVQIKKLPSAPHITSSRTLSPASDLQAAEGGTPQSQSQSQSHAASAEGAMALQQLQAALLSRLREVVGQAEDVGTAFAREARAIHDGESEARAIRGTASEEERQELAEDGISIMQVPDFLTDDRLQ